MEKPLISIIVPIYNVEKYLDKCISSIVSQTYTNLEIILVDDGSPDNCPQMCDEWAKKDERIKVVHKENGGLSSARNAGIKIAKGDYIGLVDSDDYISPYMYENLLSAIQKNNADLAICGTKWINEDGSNYDKVCKSPIRNEVFDKFGAFEKLNLLGNFYYVTTNNKLYKKFLFDTVSFPEGRIHEDEFTIHHFFNNCNKIASIEEELYFYIQRNNSITHVPFSIKRFDKILALHDRFIFFKKEKQNSLLSQNAYACLSLFCEYSKKIDMATNRKYIFSIFYKLLPLLSYNPKAIRFLPPVFLKYAKNLFSLIKLKFKTKKLFSKRKKKQVIALIATPSHRNLGDHAIVLAEKQFLADFFPNSYIVEVSNDTYKRIPDYVAKLITKEDIIVIDGGGNLGTLWPHEDDKIRDIVNRFYQNKVVVFPQTCYYEDCSSARIKKNNEVYCNASNLHVMLRDKDSYDFFKKEFPAVPCSFVPDIVLSLRPNVVENRRDVLLCFRQDHEKSLCDNDINSIKESIACFDLETAFTSTLAESNVSIKTRRNELCKKWSEFASSKLVITDRLHAMIFCAITRTPCVAFNNKSNKVKGTYDIIKDLPFIFFASNTDDCIAKVKIALSSKNDTFFDYPMNKIKEVFDNTND